MVSEATAAYGWVSKSLYVPTGDQATSTLLLTKEAPAEVSLGAPFEYRLTATNLTNSRVEDVSITDTVPSGLDIIGSSPAITASEGSRHTWVIGDLGPGESRTVTVQATANSQGEVTYCAEVRYAQLACVTTRVVEPSLQLTATSPAEVVSCDCFPVNLRVTNNGTGTARDVVINATLPAGFTHNGSGSIRIPVGDLASGESREQTAEVCASGPGVMDLQATATAGGGLTADAATGTVAKKPMLEIEKEGRDWVYGGNRVTYMITVRNTGDGVAQQTIVEDQLPANVSFVSADNGGTNVGNTVSWNLGNLQPGDSRNLQVVVRAEQIGVARNVANARAYCADAVTASTTTEVKGIPAILLEVIDLEDPVPVGQVAEYLIKVYNQGSAPDTNIRITCELEDTMEFASASGATRGSHAGGTVTFDSLPSLAPKATAEWRVRVKAVGSGDVRFKVIRETDETTRPVTETESTNFYE
ncbi:MAG: DUF11 domain-containing protein [Planctomycetes bacterium]|nr:DUF11 domain-containing protein [Planctomycetota bacterium]